MLRSFAGASSLTLLATNGQRLDQAGLVSSALRDPGWPGIQPLVFAPSVAEPPYEFGSQGIADPAKRGTAPTAPGPA